MAYLESPIDDLDEYLSTTIGFNEENYTDYQYWTTEPMSKPPVDGSYVLLIFILMGLCLFWWLCMVFFSMWWCYEKWFQKKDDHIKPKAIENYNTVWFSLFRP